MDLVTPNYVEKLKVNVDQSRKCALMCVGENNIEVEDVEKTCIVHLLERTCEYGAFQIPRLPCKHAAPGIVYRRDGLEDKCDEYFSNEACLKAYLIHPNPYDKRWTKLNNIT